MSRAIWLAVMLSIAAVAVRLNWINQPFVDNWSWRQSDVAAIARNFYERKFDFARPQIDWAGDQPGYVGTEFPILPFIAALSYKALGVHEWIGRVQAIVLFAASLPFFFLLVRRVWPDAAIWALVFYGFAPVSVFAGREFMPDVPSLSLAIAGLYLFHRWVENQRLAFIVAAGFAVSLSILIKLPSAVIGAPLACLVWQKWRWTALRKPALWAFGLATLLPAAIWYEHARAIAANFYPHHFFGAGGVRIENFWWYWRIAKELVTASLSWPLALLTVGGIFLARARPRMLLFYWWLTAMIGFTILVGYGNRHQWYQLPFVPIAAVLGGGAWSWIVARVSGRAGKIGVSSLVAVLFCATAFPPIRHLYHSPPSVALREAGLALRQTTPQGALVVAADIGDPTVFYYAERKGWHLLENGGIYQGEPLDSAEPIADLDQLRRRGAGYLVFTSMTAWWLDYYRDFADYLRKNADLVAETPSFKIYQFHQIPK